MNPLIGKEKCKKCVLQFSPTLQIARPKASNQISEDIPQTRAALETPATWRYDFPIQASAPLARYRTTRRSRTRWPCYHPPSYIIVFFSCECRSSTSLCAECLGNIVKYSLTFIIHWSLLRDKPLLPRHAASLFSDCQT